MKPKILIEEFLSKPTRIDHEQGVLVDCLLLGPASRNGTDYPLATRERALTLLEGAKVNLSHPARRDKASLAEAVTWDRRIGKAFNLRNTPDGIRGDVKVLKKHPFTSTLMEAAEEMPEMFGFSPVMVGVCRPEANGRETCVEIKKVKSIDIVTDPGTTRSLFEEYDMTQLLKELHEEEAPPEKKEEPQGGSKEDETLHQEEIEELEGIDEELRALIEQVTAELVDFHHEHQDPERAHKRVGEHIKHHHKMHLKKEEPKEESKEGEKEESKEEEEHKEEEDRSWSLLHPEEKVLVEDQHRMALAEDQKSGRRVQPKKAKSGYAPSRVGHGDPDENWMKLLRK